MPFPMQLMKLLLMPVLFLFIGKCSTFEYTNKIFSVKITPLIKPYVAAPLTPINRTIPSTPETICYLKILFSQTRTINSLYIVFPQTTPGKAKH